MAIAILSPAAVRQGVATGGRSYAVIDARPRDAFDRGHILGALWMGWEQWCAPGPAHAGSLLAQDGYWGVLVELAPEALAHRLAACGVSSDRPLVVYADGPRSLGREGRIAWMLLYLGASSVYLLDGGWGGWLAAGGPVETSAPNPPPGHFTVAFREQRRVRLPQLKQAYRAGTLPLFIDTRCQAEFAGDQHDYMPRRGHLPSAVLPALRRSL